MNLNKAKALSNLCPNSEWALHEDELEWLDKNVKEPTKKEIDDEIERIEQEYETQEYSRDREKEYPPIAEQLDYIYHNGLTKWKSDMIKPVKDKYPK
tara:strand:+ start:66 stop:356 length:291 start_codon:yes stop_codon:yes gene_type:complete